MLTFSQAFLAVLMAAAPTQGGKETPAQIVQLENVTITLTPELAKLAKIETVKSPKGTRIRLTAGGMTLEATRFTVKEEGKDDWEMSVTPVVGGNFFWLNTIEYQIPILTNDKLHGVIFCDHGTVEQDGSIQNFRVAVGSGIRVSIPALGPLPLALDFPIPVNPPPLDMKKLIDFSMGLFGGPNR
jgi:hypothetical protein